MNHGMDQTGLKLTDLNTARHGLEAGITTSALAFGGLDPSFKVLQLVITNESWNGSSWTEVNDLNTEEHLDNAKGNGTATSALSLVVKSS